MTGRIPANLDVIEQIVLARNRGQHAGDLTTFNIPVTTKRWRSIRSPSLQSANERETWLLEEGTLRSFLMPSINITRDNLFAALDEVGALAAWI
jgi:hypothetical protein